MSTNKLVVILLLIVFASCHQVMAKIPAQFADNNYIFAFVSACIAVAAILSFVRD